MVFKLGNTPWNKDKHGVQKNIVNGMKDKFHSEEAKQKISKSLIGNKRRKGIPHSEDIKRKIKTSSKKMWESESFRNRMSEIHKKIGCPWFKGRQGWNRGIKTGPESEETRKKKSISHKLSSLHRGDKHPNWSGGKRLAGARHHNKRRQLGFTPLNLYFENSEAHHINKEHVIYIPKLIHQTTNHQLNNIDKMNSINAIAYFFLMQQNINELASGFVAVL